MKLATKLAALMLAATASTAIASDLPSKKTTPAQPVMEQSTWTGFYAGVYGGYSFAQDTKATDTGVIRNYNGADGFIGGVQAGYDHQMNTMVLGVAGDFGYNGVSKTWINAAHDYQNKIEGKYSGSLRGRVGYLINKDVLLYATGGWAFMNAKVTGDDIPSVGAAISQSKTLNGYTVGAGIEYKITKNVSINTEYRYSDYAKTSFSKFGAGVKASSNAQDVRVGLNYRF